MSRRVRVTVAISRYYGIPYAMVSGMRRTEVAALADQMADELTVPPPEPPGERMPVIT